MKDGRIIDIVDFDSVQQWMIGCLDVWMLGKCYDGIVRGWMVNDRWMV